MTDEHEHAPTEHQRVSISLATLRSELIALELRLVDRLNSALDTKADRQFVDRLRDQIITNDSRLLVLENRALLIDSPFTQKVTDLDEEMAALRELSKYKKWLWVQTISLIGIAVPVAFFVIQHILEGGTA